MNPTALPPPPFKDRKIALVLFGVVTAGFGSLVGLMVPLMFLSMKMAAQSPDPPPAIPSLLPAAFVYCTIGAVLVWLGIGSILARRWARALLVTLSWMMFAFGVLAVSLTSIVLTGPLKAALRPGQMWIAPVIAFVFVVLPLVWALFYGGKNVKATCEARDPVLRWTDCCPLPVLAICLFLALAACTKLISPLSHFPVPFFGLLLPGIGGTAFRFGVAAAWVYAAWAIYRMDRRGWWVAFLSLTLYMASNLITYAMHDFGEIYFGILQTADLERIKQMGFMSRGMMIASSSVYALPILGYLLYIRKFFPKPAVA